MASDTDTDGRGLDPSVVDASTVALAQGTDVDDGLSTVEAAKRLEKHGENKLVGASPVPAWKRFLLQFKDPPCALADRGYCDQRDRVGHRGSSGRL